MSYSEAQCMARVSSAMYRPGLLPDSDPGLCAVNKQNF